MMYTGIKAFTLSEWFQDLFSDSSDPNVSKWRDGLLHNFLKEWSDRTFSSLEVIWLNVLITLKLDGGFEKQHLHLVRLLSLRLQHSSKFAWKLESFKIIQLSTRDESANEQGQSHVTYSICFESRLLISSLPPVTHSCWHDFSETECWRPQRDETAFQTIGTRYRKYNSAWWNW